MIDLDSNEMIIASAIDALEDGCWWAALQILKGHVDMGAYRAALAAGSRRAKTAQPVESEGRQSGPQDIAQSQPLGNPLDTGDGK